MNYFLLSFGIFIYIVVVSDMVMTTLTMKGGGWLTSRLSHCVWNLALRSCGNEGRSNLLTHIGYLLLVLIVLVWIGLLNCSFSLVLIAQDDSVINASTKVPANIWEKIYYSGFVLSTLGIGDFVGSTVIWRIITNVYAFTGFVLITMSVTYFIPVLGAVKKQRKLGINISGLGPSPQKIILNGWNGENFDFLKFQLFSLSDDLVEHNQNHRAYPIIHFFHNSKSDNAIIIQIAVLNEVILLFENYIRKDITLNKNDLLSMHSALNNYVDVIKEVTRVKIGKTLSKDTPHELLAAEGLIVDNNERIDLNETLRKNQRVFQSLIVQDGWQWEEVIT
ncbi:potassium channel family protein [Aquimarina intermedia]|uniref:Ion channel n=1 Tax=Aquimarina intermedia TaxID=350814 RepID=A0A5S5C4Y9_9FLAO|nr:potassium channel family protein [Aquimarina intermedia]TYP74377.1 ion channel [Aquimarina intermedia]